MTNENAIKTSAQVTVAGALASVFFADWIHDLPIWLSPIFIILYTFLIFWILYQFFNSKKF